MQSFGWWQSESRAALVAYVVMVAGMIATPLFEQGGDERRVLALVVVSALFVTSLSAAVRDQGLRSVFAALAIVVVTFLVEILGSKTGFPFGEYDYTGALTPQIFGVPIVVAFAWAGITLTVHGALRDVRIGHMRIGEMRTGRGSVNSGWQRNLGRVALMACAITAWDAFLDPQMVGEGYWQWQLASPAYRGIPLVNYLGWLLTGSFTSVIVIAVCGRRKNHDKHDAKNDGASGLPRITYATLAVLSTIGFAIFFDDIVVAVVGGVTMGIFVWLSYASRTRWVA